MSFSIDMDKLAKKYEKLLQQSDEFKGAGNPKVSISFYPNSPAAVQEQLTSTPPEAHPRDTPKGVARWGKRAGKSIKSNQKN
jgi:hypothetical protein